MSDTDGTDTDGTDTSDSPTAKGRDGDFGPGGYLPERAAARARKIILRSPLGMHWIWAALGAGLVVLVAGTLFLNAAGDPPGPPYVAVGPLVALPDAAQTQGVLVVTAAGGVRAFDAPEGTVYCATSGNLEAPDGRAWLVTGRGLGTPSLPRHPTVAVDGIVYVDPTTTEDSPRPNDAPVANAC